MSKCVIGPNSNVKIGFRMSKFDIWPKFEFKNRLQNVETGFRMSKCYIQPEFEFKIMVLNVKCDIRPEFECQNMISNVKMRYSAPVRKS